MKIRKIIKIILLIITLLVSNIIIAKYCNLDIEPEIRFFFYSFQLNIVLKVLLCALIDFLLFAMFIKSSSVMMLARDLLSNRRMIMSLAVNDFKTKYAGSYLGITWAFVMPVTTILIYCFVFQYGLRAGSPIEGIPFILWFSSGLISWFFFSEALMSATNSLVEYSYLVKKVVFKISILPIVKVISALFIHFVFIALTIIFFIIYNINPTIYAWQLLYYVICAFAFVLAISFTTASVVIFFKDLTQIINIFLQIGMWMTPIMWSYTMVPANFLWIVKLNPMFYVVDGYRDSLINKIWFWEKYFQTAYFWIFTFAVFIFGAIVFKKLKVHFADVI